MIHLRKKEINWYLTLTRYSNKNIKLQKRLKLNQEANLHYNMTKPYRYNEMLSKPSENEYCKVSKRLLFLSKPFIKFKIKDQQARHDFLHYLPIIGKWIKHLKNYFIHPSFFFIYL